MLEAELVESLGGAGVLCGLELALSWSAQVIAGQRPQGVTMISEDLMYVYIHEYACCAMKMQEAWCPLTIIWLC